MVFLLAVLGLGAAQVGLAQAQTLKTVRWGASEAVVTGPEMGLVTKNWLSPVLMIKPA